MQPKLQILKGPATRNWVPGIQDSQPKPFVAVLQGTPHVIADIILGKPEKNIPDKGQTQRQGQVTPLSNKESTVQGNMP